MNTMKLLLLSLGLMSTPILAADAPVTNVAPLPSSTNIIPPIGASPKPIMATKSVFIAGLKEPQGMVFTGDELLVCDYGSGEILKFTKDGKSLGVLATGLKGPAQIVTKPIFSLDPQERRVSGEPFYVTERKANRVIIVDEKGKITPLEGEIAEPLGLSVTAAGLTAVSHTTSKIYKWRNADPRRSVSSIVAPKIDPKGQWEPVYSAPSTDGERYGFRWLTSEHNGLFNNLYFLSDEVGERILMLTSSGRVATFATGISDPSGIVIGPDKMVYVANEGDGGQLIRLNAEGEKTIVAEGLGRPRGMVFVDAKTLLVSNRDGNVWRVVLP